MCQSGHRGLVLLSEKLDLSAGIGVLSFSARSLTLVPSYASQREASPPFKATVGRSPRLLPWGGARGVVGSLRRGLVLASGCPRSRLGRDFSSGTSLLFSRPVVVFGADISGSLPSEVGPVPTAWAGVYLADEGSLT